MTNFIKSVLYISVCIAIASSCKDEPIKTLDYNNSYGSWILSEAQKDGKVTRTLEGTTFDIDTARIATNLFGVDQNYLYERNGSRIQLTEKESQIFTVMKSTPDTLVLNMKRKSKTFQLLMIKDTKSDK